MIIWQTPLFVMHNVGSDCAYQSQPLPREDHGREELRTKDVYAKLYVHEPLERRHLAKAMQSVHMTEIVLL
jgi:hypothetical protein